MISQKIHQRQIKAIRGILIASLLFVVGLFYFHHIQAQQSQTNEVIELHINSAIGPAVADYINRGIKQANLNHASMVLIQIDTPGGLANSMRDIIQTILSSSIPVVTYVSPSGARAASAGTYILYASHVAAMAPGTNVGASTPVSLGASGEDKQSRGKAPTSSIDQKATNDASAYIRSLAQLRGRNVEWAVKSVMSAESLSAEEALKQNVIDMIAKDRADLLNEIHGRTLNVSGQPVTLNTKQSVIKQINPDWRSRFLSVITDPSVAYLLMMAGIFGLFVEFTTPGVVLPGVVGTISLLVALYAFQLLPINYVGLTLIVLGIGFMIAEAFISSYGALGIGGVIAFVVGSIMLMDTTVPGFTIALPLILTIAAVSIGLILLITNIAMRSQYRKVVTGREELLDSTGTVINISDNIISVRIKGEVWQAKSSARLSQNQKVKVISIDGLILHVEPDDSHREL